MGRKGLYFRSGRSICASANSRLKPEQPLAAVDLAAVQFEIGLQDLQDVLRHLLIHLQPHHAAELALPHALLDGFQQIFRFQFLDRDIGVARHVERDALRRFACPGNRASRLAAITSSIQTYDSWRRVRVRLLVRTLHARQRHQRGQRIGYFDAREALVAAGIADQDGQIQTEIRDVRERPARGQMPAA